MRSGLDLAVAAIIGGMLLLLLINLNSRVSDETNLSFTEGMPVAGASQLKLLLDNDLPKIGYGYINPKHSIRAADSTHLQFICDTNRTDLSDTVVIDYSVNIPIFNRTTLTFPNGQSIKDSLPNPNEIFVLRKVQGASLEKRIVSYGVTRFRFDYYTANETPLIPPIANFDSIKMVRVTIRAESRWRMPRQGDTTRVTSANAFPAMLINKMYRPRNLY